MSVAGTCAIAVIAKAPRPGQVKTRLHGLLSPEEAAAFGSALLRDTLENVAVASRTAPIASVLAYAPAGEEGRLRALAPVAVSLLLAEGAGGSSPGVEGFGRVLLETTRALLARGYAAACVLAADSPTVPSERIARAARLLLEGEAEAVLGPAEDGGYWLLGLTRPDPHVFAGIRWSTSHAAADTRARMREAGLRVAELGLWYDLDDVESVGRLATDRAGFSAPSTSALIRSLGILGRLEARATAGNPRAAPAPRSWTGSSPLLEAKDYDAEPVFRPENLLREARRQKSLPVAPVPSVCVLDPDGDIVRRLRREGRAKLSPAWACYHTELYEFDLGGVRLGIVGCAVGASFAVLVAEQLFASGCGLIVSITSAGRIAPLGAPPYFVLIERALRDEGTSHHYLPPAAFSRADPDLLARVQPQLAGLPVPVHQGASWTTDAPFRETAAAVAAHRRQGIAAVEMEAAALYAFAEARRKPVLCFAHVTNEMGQSEGDFEKGEADGTAHALLVLEAVAQMWTYSRPIEYGELLAR